MMTIKDIGHRLRQIRHRKTQQQMADILEIPYWTYRNYEIGKTVPPVKILAKIAELFGVSIDWIVTGGEKTGEKLAVVDRQLKDTLFHIYGNVCAICGEGRKKVLEANYIEASHIKPISKLEDANQLIKIIENTIVLCANCHQLLLLDEYPRKMLQAVQEKAIKNFLMRRRINQAQEISEGETNS